MPPAVLVSTALVLWSGIATPQCPPMSCAGPSAGLTAPQPGRAETLAIPASISLLSDPWLCALDPDWWQPVQRARRLTRGCQFQALAAVANLTGPAAACSAQRVGTLFALGFTTDQVLSLCAAARVRRPPLAA